MGKHGREVKALRLEDVDKNETETKLCACAQNGVGGFRGTAAKQGARGGRQAK